MTKKYLAGLALAAAMTPALAFAQTADVQSQVQALLNQIKTLQEQLKTLVQNNVGQLASTTANVMGMSPGQFGKQICITLNRNLGVGSRGDDVKQLQQMLADDPESDFHAGATGFFGPMTARAMMNFQMRMGIASSTTGAIGPLTRGFFERRCGKGEGGGNGAGPSDKMPPRGISGSITVVNGSAVTIQNRDGVSVIVNVSASTSIQVFNGTSTPPTAGSLSDLTVGKMANADGPKNQDGSIQAVHVMVGTVLPPLPRPEDGRGPQGGRGDDHGPQNW